ncbi:MAG TPA: RNA polymerase sigma factor [Solirubrobacteraceae bacterium]|nr:RNA polymerase sigma factor [Solirubrobacteraceae bacterium]
MDHALPAPTVLDPARLHHHLPRLRRLAAYLTGSREGGDDLVQDTLERVLRSPRRIHGDEYPYLTRALRNTHVDRARAAARQPQTVELGADVVETARPGSEARAEAVIDAREVLAAVAGLPDAYRLVVVAVDVQGCSYQETADRLGVPVGTVMSRLYRGRRRVVEAVEGRGAALAPVA